MPSGQALGRLIARQVDRSKPGLVIELGGGTGAITDGLLDSGIKPQDLVVVERDRELATHLKRQFPFVRILHGNALALDSMLAEPEQPRPICHAVISGLPLLIMPPATHARLLEQSFALLAPGGVMVQFTYGLFCPFSARLLKRYGLQAKLAGAALANVPPAFVWRISRRADNPT